mmetsp:Transcript_2365/g.7987  ORF Transcript_2365/g.7987 Transcript_2365/m.7987 type:complete len:430 (-) Transcript_2365:284-1573(-)
MTATATAAAPPPSATTSRTWTGAQAPTPTAIPAARPQRLGAVTHKAAWRPPPTWRSDEAPRPPQLRTLAATLAGSARRTHRAVAVVSAAATARGRFARADAAGVRPLRRRHVPPPARRRRSALKGGACPRVRLGDDACAVLRVMRHVVVVIRRDERLQHVRLLHVTVVLAQIHVLGGIRPSNRSINGGSPSSSGRCAASHTGTSACATITTCLEIAPATTNLTEAVRVALGGDALQVANLVQHSVVVLMQQGMRQRIEPGVRGTHPSRPIKRRRSLAAAAETRRTTVDVRGTRRRLCGRERWRGEPGTCCGLTVTSAHLLEQRLRLLRLRLGLAVHERFHLIQRRPGRRRRWLRNSNRHLLKKVARRGPLTDARPPPRQIHLGNDEALRRVPRSCGSGPERVADSRRRYRGRRTRCCCRRSGRGPRRRH